MPRFVRADADILIMHRNFDRDYALKITARAIARDPYSAELRVSMAGYLYDAGRHDLAGREVENVRKITRRDEVAIRVSQPVSPP